MQRHHVDGESEAGRAAGLELIPDEPGTNRCSEHEIQAWGGGAGLLRSPPGVTLGQSTAGPARRSTEKQSQESEPLLSAFLEPVLLWSTAQGHFLQMEIPVSPHHRGRVPFRFPKELSLRLCPALFLPFLRLS